jgi:hypothetical protein
MKGKGQAFGELKRHGLPTGAQGQVLFRPQESIGVNLGL